MKLLIMCIGNREGGDDSIGPYIADNLLKLNLKKIDVIDCGVVPENYTSIVKEKNPDKLIIIDAIDMGLSASEIRVIPENKIGKMHVSTHGIPLSVLIEYLHHYVKKIILIGIQPKKISGKISKEVILSGNNLIENIKQKKCNKIKVLH